MITNDNRKRVLNELWLYVHSPGTNFTHKLFDLIAKADRTNRSKIARGFPDEVLLWTDWQEGAEYEVFWRHRASLESAYRQQLFKIVEDKKLTTAYASLDRVEIN